MSDLTTRRTRASNANAHPGHVILNTTRKRRTKVEIAADNKRIQEQLEAKEADALEGIQRLANIQAEMEQTQSRKATKKPTAVRPRPIPVKKKLASQMEDEVAVTSPDSRVADASDQVEGKFTQDKLTMDMDIDISMSVDEVENVPKARQRIIKPSLKDAVNAARLKMIRGAQDNDQVTTASKATTSGSQQCPPQKPAARPVPDSVLDTEDTLVGGFGDADGDGSHEYLENGFQGAKKGRMQAKITDSIEEVSTTASQPKKAHALPKVAAHQDEIAPLPSSQIRWLQAQ
ncbi:hypothetical protein AZE42_12041, partial [Rhizopogon vesiculosus]